MQSRWHSFIEAMANVIVGYGVAIISQVVIFSMKGLQVSLHDNLVIGLWFTAVSIVRSYAVRRMFNRLHRGLDKPYQPR